MSSFYPWLQAFGGGLAVGVTLTLAGMTAKERRWRHALRQLLDGGRYRLKRADGQVVDASELLDAVDAMIR